MDRVVHPVIGSAGLWLDGELRPLPTGTLMGIPGVPGDGDATGDPDRGEPVLGPDEDVAVGALVRERLGDEVVEHLVDPLLGGVYAGRADLLSLQATIPALHKLLRSEHTLRSAVTSAVAASKAHSTAGPVFGTLQGGLSALISAAEQRLTALGVDIHYGRPLRALEELPADGYVLACPATPLSRLVPEIGVLVDYASVGLVNLRLPDVDLPQLSGFLVPADQGLSIKAATFFSRKWDHLSIGDVLIRASVGRYGDTGILAQTDAALVDVVHADLAKVIGPLPPPKQARVTRWGGGLPQYAPGHVARVAQVREAMKRRRIALAGAAFDGVGIPACITSGERAAADLEESLS
jgi:oxygen-dependent protoporphyrinogen oxidase